MRQSAAPKKASPVDWHPADVISALRKRDWSLRQIALDAGYADLNVVSKALRQPYPKAERLIADALGILPQAIWPSRYDEHGIPNRPRGAQARRPAHPNSRNGRADARVATTQK